MSEEKECLFHRLYRWASQRLYHEAAWAYEVVAWLVSLGQWDAWRRQALDHVVGERVLEVGFGTGQLLAAAAHRGLDVWGVDLSREMQRVAAHTVRRHGVDPPRIRARVQALPFGDASFDTIISTFPTPYVFEWATLSEIRRLLRAPDETGRGGRFVVTGIGFRTESLLIRRLLTLVFGGGGGDGVAYYRRFAETVGFAVTVVDDPEQKVRVPVVILEKGGDRGEGRDGSTGAFAQTSDRRRSSLA